MDLDPTLIPARAVRHFALGDPLLDWLDAHGGRKGFTRDSARAGYDPRSDLSEFLRSKQAVFEELLLDWLSDRVPVARVGPRFGAPPSLALVTRTLEAMLGGAPVVARGALVDAAAGLTASPLLLVRSDVLWMAFPGGLELEPTARGHYVPVVARFTTLDLNVTGELALARSRRADAAELHLTARVLGAVQSHVPASSFVVGRGWRQGEARGTSAVERLGRVRHDACLSDGRPLAAVADEALRWVRLVRSAGAKWNALPEPTNDRLRPNMKNDRDAPWRRAKEEIARAQEELTRVWHVGSRARDGALAAGVTRSSDPRLTPALLGSTGQVARVQDALLKVNARGAAPALSPVRLPREHPLHAAAPLEVFTHFEATNDLDGDSRAFPERGGRPTVFLIACGHAERGVWRSRVFTADALTLEAEARLIDAWLAHVADLRRRVASDLKLLTWSLAEQVSFERAYDSARTRHPARAWPTLPWLDVLRKLLLPEPIVVRGALSFHFPEVHRALVEHGLAPRGLDLCALEGSDAVAAAFAADQEAELRGVTLREVDLIAALERRGEAYCLALSQTLQALRDRL